MSEIVKRLEKDSREWANSHMKKLPLDVAQDLNKVLLNLNASNFAQNLIMHTLHGEVQAKEKELLQMKRNLFRAKKRLPSRFTHFDSRRYWQADHQCQIGWDIQSRNDMARHNFNKITDDGN